MRIVTRPDFDGIVCAVIISEAEKITEATKWVEPHEIQNRLIEIKKGDIMANLPFDNRCSIWFDHHYSNRIESDFTGSFKMAPSAAGVVFSYYEGKIKKDYTQLVKETDKIDSASLSMDEVINPEAYPYVLLSMTVSNRGGKDEAYWNRLVWLLMKYDIEGVIGDFEVKERCRAVIEENRAYQSVLIKNTILKKHVSITDLRSYEKAPEGNRFLVYSLFPDANVSVRIRYDDPAREIMAVSVGHNIFNPGCRVNVGKMLSKFGGGGHKGAGACRFPAGKADEYLDKIIAILIENSPDEY
jgi:oligoribonuclease NrnB/cAMP/cGMP phosphodiesterase (DHH superfamily)